MKFRAGFYAFLIVMGAWTLYIQMTDTTADNGAACTVIGLVTLFLFEVGYSFADARAKRE